MTIAGILLLGSLNQVFAQGREITGTVTASDTKLPVAGVTVTVKGTKKAVATDPKGNFRITVDNGVTDLIFSSVGYVPTEVNIAGKTTADVELVPEVKQTEEVVVIGKVQVEGATGNRLHRR